MDDGEVGSSTERALEFRSRRSLNRPLAGEPFVLCLSFQIIHTRSFISRTSKAEAGAHHTTNPGFFKLHRQLRRLLRHPEPSPATEKDRSVSVNGLPFEM